MSVLRKRMIPALLWLAASLWLAGGCCWFGDKTPTPPLGTQSDDIWRRQEVEAAASDFVIYEHEFRLELTPRRMADGTIETKEGKTQYDQVPGMRLNLGGQDHLKSIAARLQCGAPMPVIIERSMVTADPSSENKFPVHPNTDLDMLRRQQVVKALESMGIANAEKCVMVSPALAEGFTSIEAMRAYERGLWENGGGAGGNGGIGTAGSMGGGGVF
jgi:hypothetical protein